LINSVNGDLSALKWVGDTLEDDFLPVMAPIENSILFALRERVTALQNREPETEFAVAFRAH